MYICNACLDEHSIDKPEPGQEIKTCDGCGEDRLCSSLTLSDILSGLCSGQQVRLTADGDTLARIPVHDRMTINCVGVGDEWKIDAEIHGGSLDSDELTAVVNLIGSRLGGRPTARPEELAEKLKEQKRETECARAYKAGLEREAEALLEGKIVLHARLKELEALIGNEHGKFILTAICRQAVENTKSDDWPADTVGRSQFILTRAVDFHNGACHDCDEKHAFRLAVEVAAPCMRFMIEQLQREEMESANGSASSNTEADHE